MQKILLLCFLFVGVLHIETALAQGGTPALIDGSISECDFQTGQIDIQACLPAFLAHTVKFVFGFAGGIFLIIVMYSGYEIILGNIPGSSGNEAGKNRLTWAIIGFILSATSFFLIDFVLSAING